MPKRESTITKVLDVQSTQNESLRMSDEHVYKMMDKIYKPHKDGEDKLDITTDRISSNHKVNLHQNQANNNRYHEYIKYSRVIVQILIYIVASLTKQASAYVTKKIQDASMLPVNKIYVLIIT